MTFVGPSAVIWPSYQNVVVDGKGSWRFPAIIAAPQHGKRAATAESDFSTYASLFPRFHDLPVRGGGVGRGKTGYFGRYICTSITAVTTIDPLSAKMICHSTEFPWNADYPWRHTTKKWGSRLPRHSHSTIIAQYGECTTPDSFKVHPPAPCSNGTVQTSIGTQPSLPSLSCSDNTQSIHVQQCGYEQCGNEHPRRGTNDPSWVLHDRWNHCHPQYHNWYSFLHIYEGFELWVYLDSIPSHAIDINNARDIREILG